MRRRMSSSCLVMAILQVITWYWYPATSRPYASSSGVLASSQQQDNQLHQYPPEVASEFRQEPRNGSEEEVRGELSRIGSRPPSCKHKCEGCVPCEAIQIPESETEGHVVHVQYANYEPEGWKCKCGLSIFNP